MAGSFLETGLTVEGLIPSPQISLDVVHKAEKKYEVGMVTDEIQTKLRKLRAIVNKLTPHNFEKLCRQIEMVEIDTAVTLFGFVSLIFGRALMEPNFCEVYADLCYHLSVELPDYTEENENITFKRVLLNMCQELFEREEREMEEVDRVGEGEMMTQRKEEQEELRNQAKCRMLNNIRLIGELYKKKLLTERVMHECIKKFLTGQHQNQNEQDTEALCTLMSIIGEMIDHPKAKTHMDAYFQRMDELSDNINLSPRVRFLLKDVVDLRKNKWQQGRKTEVPKTIAEIHRDAVQKWQEQAKFLAFGLGVDTSGRRGPQKQFGQRGSNTTYSQNPHSGYFRGSPSLSQDYSNQVIQLDKRWPYFKSRTLSSPSRTVKWQQKIVEEPNKIAEIYKDAAHEEQTDSSRAVIWQKKERVEGPTKLA